MTTGARPAVMLAAAGVLLLITAPAALAQPVPVPGPDPVPGPVPVPTVTNNGVPMGSPNTGVQSSTTTSYVNPLTTVPNINGDPCSGAWESVVCYSMSESNQPAVVPRSTISSSP